MSKLQNAQLITKEIANLPPHYHETFSKDFLPLLAALRLHGFTIFRADEAQPIVTRDDDLWVEAGHPSVGFIPR